MASKVDEESLLLEAPSTSKSFKSYAAPKVAGAFVPQIADANPGAIKGHGGSCNAGHSKMIPPPAGRVDEPRGQAWFHAPPRPAYTRGASVATGSARVAKPRGKFDRIYGLRINTTRV